MKECTTHHYACDCREAKFKKLYIAVNKMLARLGADGEVNTSTDEVCELMSTLSTLDVGFFDTSKVFDNQRIDPTETPDGSR
jgi:hypothetical protein